LAAAKPRLLAESRLSLEYWITRSSAQFRTRRAMTTACVTEWHSKFHAMARGIEATLLKKWMIP
jgi:hypothetical protein